MRAAVLAYHGANVSGNDYRDNDHLALAEDLRTLQRAGLPVVPLHALVDALLGRGKVPERCVALSFDDGTDLDWRDLPHPAHGMQRSFANVLRDAAAGGQPVHGTSFVIASPEARHLLDRDGLAGLGWCSEDWWPQAVDEGLLAIENHSWDHQHALVPVIASGLPAGRFDNIETDAQADAEIAQASDYLDRRLPQRRTRLFAYPYGHSNAFLREDYLPRRQAVHRLDAAFTCEPQPVTTGSHRWTLGRYVCGYHWRAPEEFGKVLADALGP